MTRQQAQDIVQELYEASLIQGDNRDAIAEYLSRRLRAWEPKGYPPPTDAELNKAFGR